MFTLNYHIVKSYALFAKSSRAVTSSGADVAVDYGMPSISTLMKTLAISYSAGVILGTGDAAESLYDYRLSGDIITGITSSYTLTSGVDEKGPWCQVEYTITNKNSSAITIREIGLMGYYTSGSACLLERTVLPTPITIAASSGVGQVTYKIHYDVPVSEQADFEALDQSGIYGVEWDYGSSATTLTRIGSAAGFADPAPSTAADTAGSSPFDSILPWSGMKRYNIIDGAVSYSQDDTGFSMAAHDTVVYIPEFYYAVKNDPYNQKTRWAISPTARDGFEKHPGSGRYVGRYHTSVVSSTYSSKSGYSPKVNITRSTARTNSHAKGDSWWLMDYATWSAIQLLYLVEYANWDSQGMLGDGNDSGSVKASGGTDACVYHSFKCSGASNQYRWIEDPWSNVYDFVDGIISSSGTFYLNTENANNGDTTTNHTSTGKAFTSNGYISRYHYVDKFPWAFIPRSAGGAVGTYVPDYAYGNTGTYVYYVGGSYSASAYSGLFYLNYLNTASNSSNLGSRLLFIP